MQLSNSKVIIHVVHVYAHDLLSGRVRITPSIKGVYVSKVQTTILTQRQPGVATYRQLLAWSLQVHGRQALASPGADELPTGAGTTPRSQRFRFISGAQASQLAPPVPCWQWQIPSASQLEACPEHSHRPSTATSATKSKVGVWQRITDRAVSII